MIPCHIYCSFNDVSFPYRRLVPKVSPGSNRCLSLNYEGSKLAKLLSILIFHAISKGKTEELDEGESAKAIDRKSVV